MNRVTDSFILTVWKVFKEIIEKPFISRNLAILGANSVGKTRLLVFLKYRIIPETEATQNTVSLQESEYTSNDKKIIFRKNLDQPGGTSFKDEWKKMVKDSDILVYVVNVNNLFSLDESKKGVEERVERDMALINEWLDSSPRKKRKLYLVGSHSDLVSGLNMSSPESLLKLTKSVPYSERFTPILACLKTREGLQKVVDKIVS